MRVRAEVVVRMIDEDTGETIGEAKEQIDFPPGRVGWVDGMSEVAAAAIEAAARAMRNRTEDAIQQGRVRACSGCGGTGLAADGDACRFCAGNGFA